MNRLQKKCVIATAGFHLLLLVILFVGPAFFCAEPKPDDTQVLDVIPANLVDARSTAASANAQPPPPAAAHPSPQPPADPQPDRYAARADQSVETPDTHRANVEKSLDTGAESPCRNQRAKFRSTRNS